MEGGIWHRWAVRRIQHELGFLLPSKVWHTEYWLARPVSQAAQGVAHPAVDAGWGSEVTGPLTSKTITLVSR